MESTVLPLPPQLIETTDLAPGGVISAFAARRPVGVVAGHHLLQLPADQHGGQARPGAGRGQPGHREAGAAGPAGHPQVRRDRPRTSASPTGSSTSSSARARRRPRPSWPRPASTWSASPARPRVGPRIGSVAGEDDDPPAPGAGRQGRVDHLRRRRRREGDHGHGLDAGPSTPARSAPPRPGCSPSAGSTTRWSAGLAQFAGALKVGDPLEDDTVVGPLITEAHRGRVEELHRLRRQ